jgi:hypothetical protein|tara:strand:- start:1189 stop:1455 length:267 start_codon:yes stop_codon:yes gene_type:complete
MKKRKRKDVSRDESKPDETYYLNLANVVLNGQVGTLPFEVHNECPKGFLVTGEPDTGMLDVSPKQQPPFLEAVSPTGARWTLPKLEKP